MGNEEPGLIVCPGSQIGPDGRQGLGGEQDDPGLAPFAGQVDLVMAAVQDHIAGQAGYLAHPAGRGVEGMNDSPIA